MKADSGVRPQNILSTQLLRRRLNWVQFSAAVSIGVGAYTLLIVRQFRPIASGIFVVGMGLLSASGVIVYRDAVSVTELTAWDSMPSLWGIASGLIPFAGPVLYLRRRHRAVLTTRQANFEQRLGEVERTVSQLQAEMQPYLNVESYLTYHHHETLEKTFERVTERLQQLQHDVEQSELQDAKSRQLKKFESQLAESHEILVDRDAYNDEFVERELNRCAEFFSNIGEAGYLLNRQQREAVVRDDTYNRVIAGAGTGKTLVLTTRVAYLIKHRGVSPDEILVSTFTGKAAEEMKERLERDFGITGVEVTTLHSFGYDVIKRRRGDYLDVFTEDDREHLIRDVIEQQVDGVPETYYDHFTDFLFYSELPDISESDFESREAFVERLRQKSYETLRGESVKSRAEKLIADFLHTHQVEYRYEKRVEAINSQVDADSVDPLASSDRPKGSNKTNKGAYRPDFYIPSADIYIEHFGIDETGEVAEWFSTTSEEYIEKIHWAREQFAEIDAELVETYQFEFDAGQLRKALKHRLGLHDVSLEKLSYDNLVTKTYEIHEREIPIWKKFSRFIELARTFQLSPGEIPDRLSTSQPAQYHFGMCGGLLLYVYERRLNETHSIDFQDMIHQAIELLDGTTEEIQYEHILVDEFQDIGHDQLRLIEVLSGPDTAHLFAVGDDWQSIYSFQGAVVDLFIEFEQYFGPTATTVLEVNYRSPAQIVEAGSALIQNNADKLHKRITADSDTEAAVVTHRLGGYQDQDHIEYTAELVVYLVQEYLQKNCKPSDIMVLCRYDDAVPHLSAVRHRLTENGIPCSGIEDSLVSGEQYESEVTVEAVHQVKGMEADHVIVTHVSEVGMGFPATDRNTDLLEPVREVEMNTIAEERRLFYVAISRSIRTLDLITRQGAKSRFIDEIEDFVDRAISANDLVNIDQDSEIQGLSAEVVHLYDDTHHTKHQDGILEDHTDSIRFVSWANSSPPTLEEDTWYQFQGIRVNEYKGDPQIVVSGATTVTEINPGEARVTIEEVHQHLTDEKTVEDDTHPE